MRSKIVGLLCAVLLAGCSLSGPFVKADYTQQDVENVKKLKAGMSKKEVVELMGEPVRTEFAAELEAWHYCRTEIAVDEYAVIIFRSGNAVQARNYSVVVSSDKSGYEDCAKFVRPALR